MHAAARIEQERHVDRRLVVRAEIDDRSGPATFKDLKVVRPEVPDDAIAGVAHERRNRDERDACLEYWLSVLRQNREWPLQDDSDADCADKAGELSRSECGHRELPHRIDFDECGASPGTRKRLSRVSARPASGS